MPTCYVCRRSPPAEMVAPPPSYRRVAAVPPDRQAQPVRAERATLRVATALDGARVLYVINVHLKSKLPTAIPGQLVNPTQQFSPWGNGIGLCGGRLPVQHEAGEPGP